MCGVGQNRSKRLVERGLSVGFGVAPRDPNRVCSAVENLADQIHRVGESYLSECIE